MQSVPEQNPGMTPPPRPPQSSGIWKWLVGGVAALFLLSLIPFGAGGLFGGSLLGGLLGGLLAGKMMSSLMGRTNTATPARQATPAGQPSRTSTSTTSRGGFGTTGRSSGFSFGG